MDREKSASAVLEVDDIETEKNLRCYPGRGILKDFKRRWKHYTSDYFDGISDIRTVSKVISTAVFLVFTILPTSIAYGILNDENTEGLINVQKVVLGQWIGGLVFGFIGGQQMLILSTTAPLSIYISVIYEMCSSYGFEFYAMYTAVGLWAQIFLVIYAVFQLASLMKFTKSAFRDTVADYALPIAVLIMALISYFLFFNVQKAEFPIYDNTDINIGYLGTLPLSGHLIAFGLGFPLSLLFFMDQLLVTKTVDNKQNRLQKGSAHHWDLLVVAVLNMGLSVLGLPWMHAALPSAYLHLKALADVEDRLHNGYVQPVIVKVRETRLAVLLAHLMMIPIYFFLIPFLNAFIPTSIFHGLFLFMAISSLTGNELWERILLVFTEQRSYPPTHYIRRVPQRTVHLFTMVEILQLALLLFIGFYPLHYVEMIFPVVIALFIPFRHFILPFVFERQYLEAIDGEH